ncbi:MAG: peptide chain release factor N(5)-glutamine methyltransferase, partial [Odoribacter sp.]|nr:peptide chain release factor N(5)-glutamine methyltransferase [Odoribacter sp.]
LIFKTHFGISRLHLLLDSGQIVSSATVRRIVEICDELKTGKPIQYVLGETAFYNCIIKVNNTTLIPRPETEELVDLIRKENSGFRGRIIDIGTGSGCIAIALKKTLEEAEVTGIDISAGAIELASLNAKLNNVAVSFIEADIFHFDAGLISPAEIIVSNPPYISESEKQYMNTNVLDFEPHKALFVTDEDPLVFYRTIIYLSGRILRPGGKVYFEINENKGPEVCRLLESAGYSDVIIIDDINGKNRFVKGRLNG